MLYVILIDPEKDLNVPEHTCPFPVYPSLQEQLWEPLVLVQFAFTSQTWLALLHSSISVKRRNLFQRAKLLRQFLIKSYFDAKADLMYLSILFHFQYILSYKYNCGNH